MCYNGFIKSARFLRLPAAALAYRRFRPCRKGGCPANHARPPGSPSNFFSILPSHTVTFSPTVHSRKSFSCNTYEFPRKCCKQKTYGGAKPFRCNTYKKQGGGGCYG